LQPDSVTIRCSVEQNKKESQRLDEGVPRTSDFDDPGLKRIESASPIALAESHFTEKHEMCHFFARLPERALTI